METEDMGAFFNKIATTFVNLSAQAEELRQVKPELEHLQQAMATLQERVTHLEGRNHDLSTDLQTTWDTVRRVEIERDEAIRTRDSVEAENVRLVDQLDHAQAVVGRLESQLADASEDGVEAERELAEARDELTRAVSERDKAEAYSIETAANRDFWRNESNRHEEGHKAELDRADGLQYQLNRAMADLDSVRQDRDAIAAKLDAIQSVFRGVFDHAAAA